MALLVCEFHLTPVTRSPFLLMKPMGPESRAHRDLDVSANKTAE